MFGKSPRQIKDWLQLVDKDYIKVQEKLQEDFTKPQMVVFSEQQTADWQHQQKALFMAHELWHRHLQAVINSEKYSIDSKWSAAEAWFGYISTEARCNDGIYTGALNSDELEELGRASRRTLNDFYGVMEAFGYNLEQEFENFKTK